MMRFRCWRRCAVLRRRLEGRDDQRVAGERVGPHCRGAANLRKNGRGKAKSGPRNADSRGQNMHGAELDSFERITGFECVCGGRVRAEGETTIRRADAAECRIRRSFEELERVVGR